MKVGLTRRAGLVGTLSLIAAGFARAADDPLAGANLYADVIRYSGFGDHRTGGEGERRTTDWLEEELRKAGYQTVRQLVPCPTFEPGRVEMELGDRRLPGFPMWPPKINAAGVTGRLSTAPRQGDMALLDFGTAGNSALSSQKAIAIRNAFVAGASGVAVQTHALSGDPVAFNVSDTEPPWPGPVVIFGGRDASALVDAARQGTTVRLRLEGVTLPDSSGDNLVARRPGRGAPVVISTPKSGWFTCASERGSGVAIWLGLARALAERTDTDLIFLATTAHERENLGGRHFLSTLAPAPGETRLWLHLGANIAAWRPELVDGQLKIGRRPSGPRTAGASPSLLSLVQTSFAGQAGYDTPIDLTATVPPGEIRPIAAQGYSRLLGLVGGHPFSHTLRDLPDDTGPDALEPVARSLYTVAKDP